MIGQEGVSSLPRWVPYFYGCAALYHGADHQGWLEEERVPIFFFRVKDVDRRFFPELEKVELLSVYQLSDGSFRSSTTEKDNASQLQS